MSGPRRIGWEDPHWRRWKIENVRRSLAMLNDAQGSGLSRDDAYRLVVELQRIDAELRTLRDELRRLAGEPD
jgi:hypothetical protein